MILRGSATVTYSAALDTSRWALVARASTHEEALELLESYERDPPLRGPSAVPWVEVDTEVMPDGSAPIRLSRSVRVF